MKIGDFYQDGRQAISFELFPPKTDKGLGTLLDRLPRLIELGPEFFTVTYGAMGTTQERTLEIASRIRREHDQEVAHHLTCVGASRDEISRTLNRIREHDIHNIVALRGDPPQGETEFVPPADGFAHASELVAHIRGRDGGDAFGIAVAGYPETHTEAPDADTDLDHLATKVAAGADVIVTQLFYDNDDYDRFVERCRTRGVTCPIVPGLMPILNVEQIERITSMCGARIPDGLAARLEEVRDDKAAVQRVSIEHTAAQATALLAAGAPGIHFYVLNQTGQIAEIMDRIRPVTGR